MAPSHPNSVSDDTGKAPTYCPACRSKDLVTTSKVADVTSYWRCCSCGEIWNVSRARLMGRSFGRPSYR